MKTLHVVPSIDVAQGAGLGASALELHRQMLVDGSESRLLTTGNIPDRSPNVETLPVAFQNPFFLRSAKSQLFELGDYRDGRCPPTWTLYSLELVHWGGLCGTR